MRQELSHLTLCLVVVFRSLSPRCTLLFVVALFGIWTFGFIATTPPLKLGLHAPFDLGPYLAFDLCSLPCGLFTCWVRSIICRRWASLTSRPMLFEVPRRMNWSGSVKGIRIAMAMAGVLAEFL